MRNRAKGREVLDRLVGRTVFAKPDGIVGHHDNGPDPHHGGETDRGPAVVGKTHEGAALRAQAAVKTDAVHGRGHGVLPHAWYCPTV